MSTNPLFGKEDQMAAFHSIDLRGKIAAVGDITFLRAEWWNDEPRFVVIRYAVDGRERLNGLRMDLDKGAILDELDRGTLDQTVTNDIWRTVVYEMAD
jgi:hypothetical protein